MVQNPNLGLFNAPWSLLLLPAFLVPCSVARGSRLAAQRPSKQLSACPGIRRPSRRRVARPQVPAAGRRAWSWRRTRGVRPCWPLAQQKLRKIQVGLGPVGIWDFDCCWAPGPTSPAAAQVAEESSSTSKNTFQLPFLQSMASKT